MQDTASLDRLDCFVCLDAGIRAGLAVEGEAALALFIDRNDGQRCACGMRYLQTVRGYAVTDKSIPEESSVGVISDAAYETGLDTELRCRYSNIRRCTAGIGRKMRDSVLINVSLGHIDQDLTNGRDLHVITFL